jgi:hypothetical protein
VSEQVLATGGKDADLREDADGGDHDARGGELRGRRQRQGQDPRQGRYAPSAFAHDAFAGVGCVAALFDDLAPIQSRSTSVTSIFGLENIMASLLAYLLDCLAIDLAVGQITPLFYAIGLDLSRSYVSQRTVWLISSSP